tara:strand:+ start:1937 stop:2098 length:162 start_codon:yes stop_codon:yes gene_type:complete
MRHADVEGTGSHFRDDHDDLLAKSVFVLPKRTLQVFCLFEGLVSATGFEPVTV